MQSLHPQSTTCWFDSQERFLTEPIRVGFRFSFLTVCSYFKNLILFEFLEVKIFKKIKALSITPWNHTHLNKNFFLTLSSYLDYFQWLCYSVSGISALCLNETPWRPTRSDGWMGQPPSWGKSRVNPSQELAASLRNSRFEGFRSRIREECRYWMHAFRFSMGELRK